jgi:precorrin-6B methylase 2
MKTMMCLRRCLLFLSFCLLSVPLLSQEQKSSSGYVPEVGQQGKDVVWVPTPQELVNKMLEMAGVTPNDFVIDLGSGDGRTVITAAKLGAKAIGVEFNPDMINLSRENAKKEGVADKTEFIQGDLFEADLSKATVITLFLLPDINLKLKPKLLDLKPGTRVVSNTFTMGDWEEDYKVTTEENWNSWNTAYMWIIPAKVSGTWKLGNSELILTQEYQMVRGMLKSGGKSQAISDGRLHGDMITFTVNGDIYSGQVTDRTMKGTLANLSEGSKADWAATRISN